MRPGLAAGSFVAVLVACGGGQPPAADCAPSCASRTCGPDGCGGICGTCGPNATCAGGVCVTTGSCLPSCTGKVCGDDGCGGTCGTCPSGAACVQGICQVARSPGCPQGGTCTYLERVAWSYACKSASDCQRSGAIATYGTFEACQTWGCMGGNSRCGDQFGNDDAERWSCEQCKVTCRDEYGTPVACGAAHETAQGCSLTDSIWGPYFADCICR